MKTILNPERAEWEKLLRRPLADNRDIADTVNTILNDVRSGGDSSLRSFTEKFDHWHPADFLVAQEQIDTAADHLPGDLKKAIALAKSNIEIFHAAQKEETKIVETSPGIRCWRKSVPIEKVGLYIPGGTAPLFSTLLMLGVPARIAGCSEIVVCSPAREGIIAPAILYTASLLGINRMYRVGGAQAIAAMAFGTESVPRVYKIFGPGNRFVTLAKQLVNAAGIAIDMPAGPSEVAVYADHTSVPAFVAADLLSQAEHGTDSQVVLVTASERIVEAVLEEINMQKAALSRSSEIEGALANSRCFVMADEQSCFELLNQYAPEHLIIASDDAIRLSELVINAGSVFLGNYAPESAGDYVSGTNHTLPTNGFATAYSGVSLDSFIKKITFQQLSREGLLGVSGAIADMAKAEGLTAHKNAVLKRFTDHEY